MASLLPPLRLPEPQPERLWTEPAAAHFSELGRLVGFLAFVVHAAEQVDHTRRVMANFMLEGKPDQATRDEWEPVLTQPGETRGALDEYGRMLQETLAIRFADNFLCFVSDALAVIFRNKPETLRSSQQVRLDFVLGFDDMESLVAAVADRRVESLAYEGLDEVATKLEKEAGLSLFDSEDVKEAAIAAVNRRNLLVHNRGIINRTWLKRGGSGTIGDLIDLHGPVMRTTANAFTAAVAHVDAQLVGKFDVAATEKVFVAEDWFPHRADREATEAED